MRNISTLDKAQSDMYSGYAFGSLGVLTSGSIWLISTIISYCYSPSQAIWTLLLGGILINPVSKVLGIITGLKEPGFNNPLKTLAMESTVSMIMCIPLAYGLSLQNTEWFFQAMLLIIGGRISIFATVFGNIDYFGF